MNEYERHFIYDRLLRKYLSFTTSDKAAVSRHWHISERDAETLLIRSIPSETHKLFACHDLSKQFDLRGCGGFYVEQWNDVGLKGQPIPCTRWALNLRTYGLVRPYRNERNRICGLIVYRGVQDDEPKLLTSRDLPLGSKAIPYNPLYESEIINGHNIRTPQREKSAFRAGYAKGETIGRAA